MAFLGRVCDLLDALRAVRAGWACLCLLLALVLRWQRPGREEEVGAMLQAAAVEGLV